MSTSAISINPLAFPKGKKLLCELCRRTAYLECTNCRVTYYCCEDHQKADWTGIHKQICNLLVPLRKEIPFLINEEERQKYKNGIREQKMKMLELTKTTGQKLLFEGKYEQAIPAAMQSLRFAIEVYGVNSTHLVPSYLVLAEASIGLDRLSQAEEYLAQANWTSLKTAECDNLTKSKLFRNLGMLSAAKGEEEDALRCFANDVYHSSLEYGTEDIRCSGAYYHMGKVFFSRGDFLVAESLFSKVTDIWYAKLSGMLTVLVEQGRTPEGIDLVRAEIAPKDLQKLDGAQQAEARQALGFIYELRQRNVADVDADKKTQNRRQQTIGRTALTYAVLHYFLEDVDKAKKFATNAETLLKEKDDLEILSQLNSLCEEV